MMWIDKYNELQGVAGSKVRLDSVLRIWEKRGSIKNWNGVWGGFIEEIAPELRVNRGS